ncbi:MAG TPA: caspase family protein [Pyrinomonadaceae bacterium]|nr:caspase family protein [Pyrinomonadaceae bacterium]
MLKADTTRPGLWVNDAWAPGTPGTFGVIIGVSRYRNLDGGQACFGLDQLYVSAITAFGFFTWLERQYLRTGSPLAKCWLLLSPTPEEVAACNGLDDHIAEPTFANCEKALQDWKVEMSRLPAIAAAQSRSVFFFSGHGLEVLEDRQILLPHDYLDPGTPIDRALSTQNISRGLKELAIPLHFLFVDACRNDHNNLGRYAPLEGARILNEPANSAINPDSFVPIFYGSAAGTQAMQPKDPKNFSLFGEALLDGLNARGLAPDCTSGACCIFLHRLRPFVGDRIKDIVRARYNQTSNQRVRVRGDQTEEPITEVAPPTGGPPPSGLGTGGPGPGGGPGSSDFFEPPLASSLQAIRPTVQSFQDVHSFFGSEQITDLWMNKAKVFDYANMKWLDKGDDIQVAEAKRSNDNTASQFNLLVPTAQSGRIYWLQIEDSVQAQAFVLPMDRSATSVFRVEMDFQFSPAVIKRFDVSLSPDNESFLGMTARLWNIYNEVSAHEALRSIEDIFPVHADELEDVLLNKVQSPLGAAIAGTILVRARRWDKLHNWLRNLANLAREIPDGAVLWTEQCLRQPDSKTRNEALEYFLRLSTSSLPFLAESTGYALRQAEDFLKNPDYNKLHDQIEAIHSRLLRAVGMFRPGGLFATFAGPANELSPFILTPTQAKGAKIAEANA